MNGFIRRIRTGTILLAAGLAASACRSTEMATDPAVSFKSGGVQGSCTNGACGKAGCATCADRRLHDKLHDFDWEQLRGDHCYPEQYNFESRRRVNQPFHDQIVAGNDTESTLYEFDFDKRPDHRGELSDAGKSRLRYLVMKKPFAIAGIAVQTSNDAATDVQRQNSVREFLAANSHEPIEWQLTMVDRLPKGLFAEEGSGSIDKMKGPQQGRTVVVPQYERILKNTFYQGSGGGSSSSGAGS